MKVTPRPRDPHIHSVPPAARQRYRGPGSRLTSPIQVQPGGLSHRSRGLQRACPATTFYSPTHYAPSGVVPGPQLGDPKAQEGLGALVAVAQAGPPAADFGTASPCGCRLYGGLARGLTFGRWRT